MTTPTVFIRTATLARVIALVTPKLRGVKVLDAAPGQDWPEEALGFGMMTTIKTEWANMVTGRKPSNDVWAVGVIAWATKPGMTAIEARARVEWIWQQLYDVVADDPKLGGTPSGLIVTRLSDIDGPDAYPEPEGFGAQITARLSHEARIA